MKEVLGSDANDFLSELMIRQIIKNIYWKLLKSGGLEFLQSRVRASQCQLLINGDEFANHPELAMRSVFVVIHHIQDTQQR